MTDVFRKSGVSGTAASDHPTWAEENRWAELHQTGERWAYECRSVQWGQLSGTIVPPINAAVCKKYVLVILQQQHTGFQAPWRQVVIGVQKAKVRSFDVVKCQVAGPAHASLGFMVYGYTGVLELCDNIECRIRTTVVRNDQFPVLPGLCQNRAYCFPDIGSSIERGHDDADQCLCHGFRVGNGPLP